MLNLKLNIFESKQDHILLYSYLDNLVDENSEVDTEENSFNKNEEESLNNFQDNYTYKLFFN